MLLASHWQLLCPKMLTYSLGFAPFSNRNLTHSSSPSKQAKNRGVCPSSFFISTSGIFPASISFFKVFLFPELAAVKKSFWSTPSPARERKVIGSAIAADLSVQGRKVVSWYAYPQSVKECQKAYYMNKQINTAILIAYFLILHQMSVTIDPWLRECHKQ